MCNLYSLTKGQQAIREFTRAMHDSVGNLPLMPGIFPDYAAPIVRNGTDGQRELVTARWGMPSSQKALMEATRKRAHRLQSKGKEVDFKQLLRMEPDGGTTNIRNTASKHWQRWLGPEHRCVVPFTSFSEFNKSAGGNIWFAADDTRPLAAFAGIWASWTSVKKSGKARSQLICSDFLPPIPMPRSLRSTPRRCRSSCTPLTRLTLG